MSDIKCPYCNYGQEINHDDGQGYTEDEKHQQQCSACDKVFTFTTAISFYYEAFKADCLNGEEHDWKITDTKPSYFSRMRCTMCEEERVLTKEEKIQCNIPTKEEFQNSLKKQD